MQIETARLVLTPIGLEHAAEIFRLHSDPVVAHWADPMSLDQATAYASEWARRWRVDGVGKWIAHRRVDGALVGRGGLSLSTVDGARQLELGWALLGSARGQGYATEIGRAGLDYAFDVLDHDHVISYTEVHNLASRAVMERLGMTFDKIIYAPGLVEGLDGVHDDAPFAFYRIDRDAGDCTGEFGTAPGVAASGQRPANATIPGVGRGRGRGSRPRMPRSPPDLPDRMPWPAGP